MAEIVTRRFVNRVDGTPITGALIRLRNAMFPSYDPFLMREIPGATQDAQGYYYSTGLADTVPAYLEGVWYIERDFGLGAGFEPWEGEITIAPKRLYSGGTGGNLIDPIINSVFHVMSIVPDGGVGDMGRVHTSLALAASSGRSKRIVVGSHGSDGTNKTWSGDGASAPDGSVIDLAGATLNQNSTNEASVLACVGDITVMNGNLKIYSEGGLGRVVTMNNPAKLAVFIGVTFERPGTAAPTVAGTANEECPAIFIGCKNVVLAPATAGSSTRLQRAVGCLGVYEVGGAAVVQLDQANASGQEIGDLIRTALNATIDTPPDPGIPFTDMKEFAEAVKQMWATEIPALKTKDEDLQNQINTATSSSGTSWTWSRVGMGDAAFGLVAFTGSISSPSLLYTAQNAYVRGSGQNAVLVLNCCALFKFTAVGSAGGDFRYSGGIAIETGAFEAALAAQFPDWGTFGVTALRYSRGGRAFGYYFKKAFIGMATESYLASHRMPWQRLSVLDGDGDGPSRVKIGNGPIVEFRFPGASASIGATRLAVSFELEIPASQLNVQAGSGSLGTIVDLPYLM